MTVGISVDICEKRYLDHAGAKSVTALRNLRACIAPSEFCVITGPSGCGKTTLLNIIAGLDRDFAGIVHFEPIPAPKIGYVFQSPRLLPWRTVRENIALVLPHDGRSAELDALLGEIGLADAADVLSDPPIRRHGPPRRACPRLCNRTRPPADGRTFLIARRRGRGPVARPAAPPRIDATGDGAVCDPRSRRGGTACRSHTPAIAVAGSVLAEMPIPIPREQRRDHDIMSVLTAKLACIGAD